MILPDDCTHTLTIEAPNTSNAEFANTLDPEEMTYDELPHLDLQCFCLLVSFIFNIIAV